jgi:hypothetical protein
MHIVGTTIAATFIESEVGMSSCSFTDLKVKLHNHYQFCMEIACLYSISFTIAQHDGHLIVKETA